MEGKDLIAFDEGEIVSQSISKTAGLLVASWYAVVRNYQNWSKKLVIQ